MTVWKRKGRAFGRSGGKNDFGIDVYSIVTIEDIIDAIKNGVIPGMEYLDKMLEYRKNYGV